MNGVLVHSRKCDSHAYGQVGHLWLRSETARQTGVWQAIESALSFENPSTAGHVLVSIRYCSRFAEHSKHVADMITSWFPSAVLHVHAVIDDSSSWNFEISVNGVVLNSMKTQGYGFFHEDWNQQCLAWKAMTGLLSDSHQTTWP